LACSFVPAAPGFSYRGATCCGVCFTDLDRKRLDPVQAGLHLVQAFRETHAQRFKACEGFATEVGDYEAWGLLTKGKMSPDAVLERWSTDLVGVRIVRDRYLLYR